MVINMIIPDFIIQDIKKNLKNLLQKEYNATLFLETNLDFNSYLDENITEIIDSLKDFTTIDKEVLSLLIKARRKTKTRWLKKELSFEPNTSIYKDIYVIAQGIISEIENDVTKFRLIYNASDLEDLKQIRITELKEWHDNDNIGVIKFKYITDKKPSQIKPAFKNDITYYVLNFLFINYPNGYENDAIITLPKTYANIPIDVSKRNKLKDIVTLEDNKKYLINDYYIEDDTIFRTLIGVEDLKRKAIEETIVKTFNVLDSDIFTYTMTLKDNNFFNTKTITGELGNIVTNVFSSDGKKNYVATKNSLFKMGLLRCSIISKKGHGIVFGLFDSVEIKPSLDDPRKEIVTIKVSDFVVEDFINQKTITLYRDKIDSLSSISKILIVRLQGLRFGLYGDNLKDISKELEIKLDYNRFRQFLTLSNKKKSNMELIKTHLEEIKNSGIIIKDFCIKGDYFYITFYPLSAIERTELLTNNENLLNAGILPQIQLSEK